MSSFVKSRHYQNYYCQWSISQLVLTFYLLVIVWIFKKLCNLVTALDKTGDKTWINIPWGMKNQYPVRNFKGHIQSPHTENSKSFKKLSHLPHWFRRPCLSPICHLTSNHQPDNQCVFYIVKQTLICLGYSSLIMNIVFWKI